MTQSKSMVEEFLESNLNDPLNINVPKTGEVVANHIRTSIIKGELKPGDKLPPEAQILERFAISRPTFREAFRILEVEGFISVRRGARYGAEVHLPSSAKLAKYAGYVLEAHDTPLKDVYETRYMLEPLAARMLAEESSAKTVKALNARIQELEEQLTPDAWSAGRPLLNFLHFHLYMIEQVKNQALTLTMLMLEQALEKHQLRQELPATLKKISDEELRKIALQYIAKYKKLVQHIEKGNASAAEKHWRKTVDEIASLWLSGQDKTTLFEVLE